MKYIKLWNFHHNAHLNSKSKEKIYYTLFLIFLTSGLHILASYFHNELLIAIAVRLNYIPAFYAGIQGGLIPGLLSGLIVASLHSIIMLQFGHATQGSHSILTEHLVETPFIILFAALIGFLRDHEQMQKDKQEKIKEIFGKYVSQSIAEKIINNEIILTGEEKVATILFCDLKGFTTLSEKLHPQDLLNLLNYFFSEMVAIILRNGGFLDKFIGDAIMAVFGIPFNEEKHPEIAVKVAVEMQSKLKELNDSKSFGEFQLSMTVGIHTGNIIAGNLGSKERMDYTVIGDTVNLASRIQSLNKTYFSDILISDSTHKSLLNYKNICVREIDTVKVKGRNKPCILYEVIHISNINSYNHKIKTLEIFSSAIILYKSGDFIASKNLFLTLIDNDSNDPLPGIYLERIENLLKNPPFNWSGIYEHLNK